MIHDKKTALRTLIGGQGPVTYPVSLGLLTVGTVELRRKAGWVSATATSSDGTSCECVGVRAAEEWMRDRARADLAR